MAKRRTFSRTSKPFFKNKSNDSIGSRFLDLDTNNIAEEQTHWWNNLEENMSSPHSLRRDNRNETSQQLNLNSQLESNHNTSQWWKYLESSDTESNTLTRSKPNLSAAIVKTNVLEMSTSESEKELSLRKKKVPLRVPSRKSDNNAFLIALNDTKIAISLKSQIKQAKYSNLHDNSDREVSGRKLDENEKHNSNLSSSSSPSPNILKSKPSIFKKKKSGRGLSKDQNPFHIVTDSESSDGRRKSVLERMLDENKEHYSNLSSSPSPNILKSKPNVFKKRKSEGSPLKNQNPFQNIVIENDNLDVGKKSVMFEKESSKHLMHENINSNKDHTDDQRKTIQLSQTLPLENNEASSLNLSTSKVLENNAASDINKTVQTSDESEIEISKRKRFKFKSHLMQRARRSVNNNNNPFEDALVENTDITLPEYNQDKKIDTRNAKSPLKTKSLSPSKIVKKKIDVIPENVLTSSPRRSPRSLKTRKHSLDISAQVQSNIERSTSNSSLDSNEFHIKRPAHLKLKSKISPLHKRSLTNNPFKEIIVEDNNVSARKSNIVMPTEDNYISVEQDETTEANQEQVIMEQYTQSMKSISKDSDTSFKILSNNVGNISEELNVQPKKKNKLSESNNVANVKSKSISQKNIIIEDKSEVSQNKKQISFNRKSTRDISKERTNTISLADKTNRDNRDRETNEIKARKITSDGKFFVGKDTPSTSNVWNLPTSKVINAESFEKIKAEVDRIKIREMAAIKVAGKKEESRLKATNVKKLFGATRKQVTKKSNPSKIVDKAYLVNGKVYKPPRLPRPKHWATDYLYKFLWKRMEPKYQLSTRVRSEKFVVLLAKVVSIIERRKKYENYQHELEGLIKEMARLNIIKTRNDFYHFCQDFMPYEFRIKVIPMLLPGNKQNIPFEPEKLHIPLLEDPY
ncbi:uncharacterized protein [Anoplolepis gracilipes]|uniref:uncharacterized protein n=1 Tax=Anoplolepis gracilipes TaxID=354296 RepID=UPI003BA32E78